MSSPGDFHNYNRIKKGVIAIVIGIDHGYSAIKTRQVCFPTGITRYEYEPYTMQNVLQYKGSYYVCGTGCQTLVKDKTANENYYLLTMAAIAQEIQKRRGERTAKVVLAADFRWRDSAGKSSHSGSICSGRNSRFVSSMKKNGMRSRLRM